jgi:Ca2+-binding RTX toxin-like protein
MINSQSIQIRRTALAVAAALTAFGAAHAAAAQASVSVEKTALGNYFVGAQSESNNLHVYNIGSEIYFEDENTTVTAGASCIQVTPKAAKCPDLPEGGLYLSMGGGTDRVDSTVTETFYVDGTQTDKLTAYAGPGPAELRGGDGNDVLHGGLGEDLIQGGKGNDVMDGSLSSDTLEGGEGNDAFKTDPGGDDYSGGAGIDSVDYTGRVAPLDITLNNVATDGQAGENDNVRSDIESVTGGKGNDEIDGSNGDNTLIGGDGDDTLTGFGGVDKLYGEADQDKLYGNDDDDALYGGEGMDRLDAGPGIDILAGMGGPDTMLGGTGNDKFYGGAGEDTVSYQSLTAPVTVDLDGSAFDDGPEGEGDTVGADVEDIFGGKGDDKLTGNGAANFIQGGAGRDTIDGSGGEDTLMGNDGDDTLIALDGLKDTANCGLDNDKVSADAIDVLVGCEDTGATPDTGGGNTGGGQNGGGGQPQTAGPVITLASKAAVKKGKTTIKVACPATAKAACTGTLTLRTSTKKKVGTAKFSVAPGKKARVTVKLSKAAVKALRKARRLKTGGTAVATAGASAKSTSTGKVTLTLSR